jgi:hypothetical protein
VVAAFVGFIQTEQREEATEGKKCRERYNEWMSGKDVMW